MKKFMVSLCLVMLVFTSVFSMQSYAATDMAPVDKLEALQDGDGKYYKYYDNYVLDIEELGLLDAGEAALHAIVNGLFYLVKTISKLAVTLFCVSFDFDFVALIGDQISVIMELLNDSIFKGLFSLAFVGGAIFLVQQLLRRNTQKIIGEILSIVLIVAASFLITYKGDVVLSATNTVVKQTSLQIFAAFSGTPISGEDGLENYAAQAGGILWSSLLHKPWTALEFGTSFDDSTPENAAIVDEILHMSPGSEQRQIRVQELKDSRGFFSKGVSADRFGYLVLILLVTLADGAIYICLGLFQIFYQAITILCLFMAPVVLLLAMIPQLGGMSLVWKWVGKFLENQLSVFVLTFVMGLILLFDNLMFSAGNQYGWLIGFVIKAFVAILLFTKRDKLMGWMGKLQHTVRNPQQTIENLRNLEADVPFYQLFGKTAGSAADALLHIPSDIHDIAADSFGILSQPKRKTTAAHKQRTPGTTASNKDDTANNEDGSDAIDETQSTAPPIAETSSQAVPVLASNGRRINRLPRSQPADAKDRTVTDPFAEEPKIKPQHNTPHPAEDENSTQMFHAPRQAAEVKQPSVTQADPFAHEPTPVPLQTALPHTSSVDDNQNEMSTAHSNQQVPKPSLSAAQLDAVQTDPFAERTETGSSSSADTAVIDAQLEPEQEVDPWS